jgi:hypothetical protein
VPAPALLTRRPRSASANCGPSDLGRCDRSRRPEGDGENGYGGSHPLAAQCLPCAHPARTPLAMSAQPTSHWNMDGA